MHPFPPFTAVALLLMADACAFYLKRWGHQVSLEPHRSSIQVLIGMSFVFGALMAYYLRRYRLRYPWWATLVSLVWLAAMIFLPIG